MRSGSTRENRNSQHVSDRVKQGSPTDFSSVNYLSACIAINLMLTIRFDVNPIELRQ